MLDGDGFAASYCHLLLLRSLFEEVSLLESKQPLSPTLSSDQAQRKTPIGEFSTAKMMKLSEKSMDEDQEMYSALISDYFDNIVGIGTGG